MRPGRGWIAVAIAASTFAVYAQVRHHEFLAYDDGQYVVDNPLVRDGLSVDALAHAFSSPWLGNWIPLSTISLQAERSLWGVEPGPVLLANAALHAAAAALLFLAFAQMTGALWASAFLGAVFGLHPLHVESVAWASERKDVLSGVFWMATLWAWGRYAAAPGAARYAAAMALGGLALLSKPMAVTLPFALLLLDYWPLGRLGGDAGGPWPDPRRLARAALEKAPLFAGVIGVSAVTFWSQTSDAAVFPSNVLPLGLRVLNAAVSYVTYVVQSLWPVGLAAFYPHPLQSLSRPLGLACAAGLLAVTAGVLRQAGRRPYLAVGWLWYLGTLVPVIGLVQVGMQAHADRYAYLPQIGLAIMLAWAGAEAAGRSPRLRPALAGLAGAGLAALAAVSWLQVGTWRDTDALFSRALAVTERNFLAHGGLGFARLEQGRPREAAEHLGAALKEYPEWTRARIGLANALTALDRPEEAIAEYQRAVRSDPGDGFAQGNLGIVLAEQGRFAEARPHLERAVEIRAREGNLSSAIHRALGQVLDSQGELPAALAQLERAVELAPDDVELRAQAGLLAEQARRPEAAAAHYRAVLEREPAFADVANNLAWLLATCREADVRAPAEALERSEAALRVAGESPGRLDTRAASLAAAGRFAEAAATGRRAAGLAEASGAAELARQIRENARRFEAGEALELACR